MVLAAAALVGVVTLTVRVARDPTVPQTQQDLYRVAEKARPRAVAPIGPAGSQPPELVWQGVVNARGYRLQIVSAEGAPLWESDVVQGTSLPWPNSLALEHGRYFWRVRALLGPRSESIDSQLVTFELGAE